MNDFTTLEGWKKAKEARREEEDLYRASAIYERRATETLQRLKLASNGVEALKAYKLWQAIASALDLAEMALNGGAET